MNQQRRTESYEFTRDKESSSSAPIKKSKYLALSLYEAVDIWVPEVLEDVREERRDLEESQLRC